MEDSSLTILHLKKEIEVLQKTINEQKEEIELSNERLESLLRISQLSTNKIQELLDFALDEAIKLTNSKIGYIYFYNEHTRQFTLNTWSKDVMQECKVANPQTVYDLDKTGVWGEAVRQRKPIIMNDFQSDDPLKKGVPEGHVSLVRFLTIPVFINNEIVAVAGVANKTDDYNNYDVRQLTLLLDNVWKVSEHIRLIEELGHAKEKAEENELLLNLLLKHSPVLMYIKDENLRALRVSQNFESLVGIPVDEMMGKNNQELFPYDFAKKMDEDDQRILQEKKVVEIEEELNGRFYTTIKFPIQIEGRAPYLAGYSIDITDRKKGEQALKESENRLSAILHTLPDLMFIQNEDGVYIDCYIPENTLPFVQPESFLGKDMKSVLPLDVVNEFIPVFKKAIETKQIQFYNYSLAYPDRLHYFETRTINYEPNKILRIIRDITEQHLAGQTIIQYNLELQKLNIDKDNFISILAHDLKNPFATILGFIDLLNNNVRKYSIDEIEKQINIIYKSANRIYNLLIDLLHWAKSQTDQLSYKPQIIVLQNACDEVMSILFDQANSKKVTLNYFEKEKIEIYADLNMIKTILRNLVSNAIKFSKEYGVVIISGTKNQSEILVEVSDNGAGITQDNLSKLWDISQPFTTKGTNGEEGTGLGLLLCKEYIERHKGKIWVESEVGRGSKFKFTIPVSPS